MAAAKLFLDRLEQLSLLDEKIIAQLRKQVADSKGPVTAETLAKVLVENGQLTVFQAKKIVGEVTAPAEDAKSTVSASKPKAEEFDLGLADDEGDKPVAPKPVAPVSKPASSAKPTAPSKNAPTKPAAIEKPAASGKSPPAKSATPAAKPASPTKSASKPASTPTPELEELSSLDELEVIEEGLAPIDEGLTELEPVADVDPLNDPLLGSAAALESSSALLGQPKAASGGGLSALFGSGPKLKNKNQWDSSLIYIGGGALALLVLAFVGLYFALARGSANEAFQLAETDYAAQSYTQAIAKYEKYLNAYSHDENASLARVRIGVSQIRLGVDEGKDWTYALALTKETLKRIEGEEKFDEARADLADILPRIAASLANQAKRSVTDVQQAQTLVKQADEAIELVNNGSYIPPSLRQPVEAKLATILEDVAVVKREISRDQELKKTLEGMQVAIGEGQTAEAYELRRMLLKKYPGLNVNEQLLAATLAATQKDREQVKSIDAKPTPTTEAPPAVVAEHVLADQTGEAVPDAAGHIATYAIGGAVYGVDAQTGKVLWRQYTGGLLQPVSLSNRTGADLLITTRNPAELRRVKGQTGEMLWRLPVDEPSFAPTIVGDKIALTTNSGKLLLIDAASGQVAQGVALSQPASQNVAYDGKRPQLYQLGEHSNLYVLSAATLECKETFFVGHKAGSIAVPPIMVAGQLFIAENAGVDYCNITFLATDADGLAIEKKQDVVRLKGTVVTPPVVDGRRVYFFTSLGAVHVFDVDPANIKQPVTVVAKLTASRKDPLASYATVVDGKVWLADERLTHYDLQPSKGDLARRWSHFENDTFLAAPQRIGSAVIHARQRRGAGDWVIAAANATDGKPLWQTSVSVSVLQLIEIGGKTTALNANGVQFSLTKPGAIEAPSGRVPTLSTLPRWTKSIPLTSDKFALVAASGEAQWGGFDLASGAKPVLGKLPGNGATISALPGEFAGGLLLPLSTGQVALVDPLTTKPLLLPFQPKLDAGRSFAWREPLSIRAANPLFAIADDRRQLYLVGQQAQPQPHMAVVRQVAVDGDILSKLATLDDGVVAVIDRAGQVSLESFALPDLKSTATLALAGGVSFGPEPVGEGLLVGVDNSGLIYVGLGLKEVWKLPLEGATIVGSPLSLAGNLVVATSQGDVLRIDVSSGKLLKRVATQRPLGGTPIASGQAILLPGIDGTVYALPTSSLAGAE